MHFLVGTVGTRGDLQPLLALGLGLRRAGHRVTMAAHADFEPLVSLHGLAFRPVEPSTRALVDSDLGRRWLESGANLVRYTRLGHQLFGEAQRRWLDAFMSATRDADAVVYYPLAWGALFAAEKRGLPVVAVPPWPGIPSGTLPHPMISPTPLPSSWLNRSSYALGGTIFSLPFIRDYREFRRTLGLRPLGSRNLFRHAWDLRIPQIHLFSEEVLPRPRDWPDHAVVTGYAFLDRPPKWGPPAALERFLAAGPPPLAIGFGSMMSRRPGRMAAAIDEALCQTRSRAVFIGGWSAAEFSLDPQRVFLIDDVPHDWLFPLCSAVVHHGGAGTTGAALRAGKASAVVSFFGDQPFWGERVRAIGAGPPPIPSTELSSQRLARAIEHALDSRVVATAARLGERIAAESGVDRAVRAVESYVRAWNPREHAL
jgi:sterol 3beta-glucosyltransferase